MMKAMNEARERIRERIRMHVSLEEYRREGIFQEPHTVAVYHRFRSSGDSVTSIALFADAKREFIAERTNWHLAGVYCDERDSKKSFEKMKADATKGLFDMILIKSLRTLDDSLPAAMEMARQFSDTLVQIYVEETGSTISSLDGEHMTEKTIAQNGENDTFPGEREESDNKSAAMIMSLEERLRKGTT